MSQPVDDEEGKKLRVLIAQNIKTVASTYKALPEAQYAKRLVSHGIKKMTAYRMLDPEKESKSHNWGVEHLCGAAKAFGVQPWQLLLPDLVATQDNGVVSILGAKARQWPFPTLQREEVEDLNPDERLRLEKTIRARISEIQSDRPKVTPASRRNKG